jgi:hypothetical protein
MHRSARVLVAALLLVAPVAAALAAEKEDPAKFKYRNLPVEASCLEGYHPTIDGEGNKVFPCVANAEIVVSTGTGTAIQGKTGATK